MKNILQGLAMSLAIIITFIVLVALWGIYGFFAFIGLWAVMSLTLGFAVMFKWLQFRGRP